MPAERRTADLVTHAYQVAAIRLESVQVHVLGQGILQRSHARNRENGFAAVLGNRPGDPQGAVTRVSVHRGTQVDDVPQFLVQGRKASDRLQLVRRAYGDVPLEAR